MPGCTYSSRTLCTNHDWYKCCCLFVFSQSMCLCSSPLVKERNQYSVPKNIELHYRDINSQWLPLDAAMRHSSCLVYAHHETRTMHNLTASCPCQAHMLCDEILHLPAFTRPLHMLSCVAHVLFVLGWLPSLFDLVGFPSTRMLTCFNFVKPHAAKKRT